MLTVMMAPSVSSVQRELCCVFIVINDWDFRKIKYKLKHCA